MRRNLEHRPKALPCGPSSRVKSYRPRTEDRRVHEFKPDELAQLEKEIEVFSVVHRSSLFLRRAPRLVDTCRKSRKLVFEYPRLHWSPLFKRARECDRSSLLRLKSLLRSVVNELYDNNVGYPVRRDAIFLVKRGTDQSYRWDIFLGGWDQCTLRKHAEKTDWDRQRQVQMDAIDVLFEPLLVRGDGERGPALGG